MPEPPSPTAPPTPVAAPATDRPRPKPTRRRFLRRAAWGVGLGVVGYAWRVEPHWVEVVRRPMPLVGLPASLVGKRVVQVSDLHVGDRVDNDYLRRTLRGLADLAPDYLAITGDFMTARGGEQIDAVVRTLAEGPIADVPTVACLGNHDYTRTFRNRQVATRLADALRDAGLHLLRNGSVEIDGLQWAGSGDMFSGECDVWTALADVDTDRGGILLAHNPDIADVGGYRGFRGWVLSGHTHGGQVRLPGIGAPVLPVHNRRYGAGHVRLDAMRDLYVNRGLGYTHRVRFGARPEVTVFTLARV